MEKRSVLSRPSRWIEELKGLTFKDVFESKRDVRKIGADVYQIKSRVEPIASLYIDLVEERKEATLQTEQKTAKILASRTPAPSIVDMATDAAKDAATAISSAATAATAAATSAIIGQRVKAKTIRLKTPGPPLA
jgi:hypothetical protein